MDARPPLAPETRSQLLELRRALIANLNVLDDTLGLPRTVLGKAERREQRRVTVVGVPEPSQP
jgi:hypothetical protein